jgi:hypothetical protein
MARQFCTQKTLYLVTVTGNATVYGVFVFSSFFDFTSPVGSCRQTIVIIRSECRK